MRKMNTEWIVIKSGDSYRIQHRRTGKFLEEPAYAFMTEHPLSLPLGKAQEICRILNSSDPHPYVDTDEVEIDEAVFTTGAYIHRFKYCGKWRWIVGGFEEDTYINGDSVNPTYVSDTWEGLVKKEGE